MSKNTRPSDFQKLEFKLCDFFLCAFSAPYGLSMLDRRGYPEEIGEGPGRAHAPGGCLWGGSGAKYVSWGLELPPCHSPAQGRALFPNLLSVLTSRESLLTLSDSKCSKHANPKTEQDLSLVHPRV